jgi:purine-nucleoside phosphorylase
VQTLIVTNAAGALNPTFVPGDVMIIDDHINLLWNNPLLGPVFPGDQRFPDMSRPYDAALQDLAERVMLEQGCRPLRGVYIGALGPSYETPAEIRMLRKLGGDAVGMSTIPEVLVARALGLSVLGLSLITNAAAGTTLAPITHEEVLAAGTAARLRTTHLLHSLILRASAPPR